LYTPNGSALAALTDLALVNGYVGTFSPFGQFTTATAASGASAITLDTAPPAGCVLVFTSITGGTGLATNTPYFVVPTTVAGQFGLSATYNGAPIVIGATALTAGAGFWTCIDKQPYLFVSNTVTSNVFTSVASQGGTLVCPHGLDIGDVVYLYLGSVTGTPNLVADQPYYVNSVPSATTFTVSATINGTTATVASAANALFAPVRVFKIHGAQIDKTTRPWMRVALQTLNGAYLQTGYAQIMFADLAIGKDNSVVS
jgi:hypothetical protein